MMDTDEDIYDNVKERFICLSGAKVFHFNLIENLRFFITTGTHT